MKLAYERKKVAYIEFEKIEQKMPYPILKFK